MEVVPAAAGSPEAFQYVNALTCPSTAGCVGVSGQGYTELTTASSTSALTSPPVPPEFGSYPRGYPLSLGAGAADSPSAAVAISYSVNYSPTHIGVLVTGIPVPSS